ncbi:MAG TPA: hypothetical protein VFF27_00475 [Bacteroidia bacterium]|jgi:hypothetical protein|nr:hypothetical protein [Bacteroidia bacterium]
MKKLESLNNELFTSFERNQLKELNKVHGGNVPSCTADHCQDTRSGSVSNPDEIIAISDQDCK